MDRLTVSTKLRVEGVRTDRDVTQALQSLFDVFAELGLGQATFETSETGVADLFIKHVDTVTVDVAAINDALMRAGEFRVVD